MSAARPWERGQLPHHLLPVHKTTSEKPKAKHEPLQCLAVQLCFANNSRFHPFKGITMFGLQWFLTIVSDAGGSESGVR